MLDDVLFNPPLQISSRAVGQKKNDVQNSAKAALISGTLTGLAIFAEASMLCIAPLAVLTVMLASCWRNESKRLAIMKTIPLKKMDHDSSSSSLDSSINTPTRRAVSAPPTPHN